MQAADPVDHDFVAALSTDIRGMYAVQVERFTPQKVETEFRKAVQDPKLTANEGFMDNLMFVVRKKQVVSLRPDVEAALANLALKPLAELSAMKTLYALGGDRERAIVDERLARKLFADLKSAPDAPGPYLPQAERLGGPRTLVVLQNLLPEAQARQKQAEQATPPNHVRISQLDRIRSAIELQALTLSRKIKIEAEPPQQRDLDLLKVGLQAGSPLSAWGYRELVRLASPGTAGMVRTFVSQELDSIIPKAAPPEDAANRRQRARLRAVLLLEELKAPLTADEQKLVEENAASIQANPQAYRPDWEAVLDHD